MELKTSWEKIDEVREKGEETLRMKVPGGWLVRHLSRNVGSQCMELVPDAKNVWEIKK